MTQRPPPTPGPTQPRLQTGQDRAVGRPPDRSTPPGAHRRRAERARSVSRFILFWSLVTFAGLATAITSFFLVAAPTDLVREELIQRVKARSGRDLAIAGSTSISLSPGLTIEMRDVALSPPPGMSGPPAVTTELLQAEVSLWSLVQGRITIKRLLLHRPVIELRVDKHGRRTWDFASASPPPRIRLAQASPPGDHSKEMTPDLRRFLEGSNPANSLARDSAGRKVDPEQFRLADVRFENGTVRYVNEPTGVTGEIQSLQLQLGFDDLAESVETEGSLVWRAEPLAFNARIASAQALLKAKPSVLSFRLSGRPVESTYQGSFRLGGAPELDGALTIKAPSLSALAAWLDQAPADRQELGPLALSAHLKTTGAAVEMSDLDAAFERTRVTGAAAIEAKDTRPYVTADLQISEVDLQRLPQLWGRTPLADSPPPERGDAVPPRFGPAPTIEDLLRRPNTDPSGPQVKGFTQRDGWGVTDLDFSWLGPIDADAKLTIGRVLIQDIRLGQTQIQLALKNSVLSTNFEDVQLYEGRGRGNLDIDATDEIPAIVANFTLEGISAAPLLKDASGFDGLAGNGKITLAVRGRGQSERQIVESLTGTADVALSDGSLVGINIPKIIRGLARGRIVGFERVMTEKTDFSELAATFTIANGIAENRDLRLASPLLRVAGTGTISLPERQLDYSVRPKLVANLSGQGGPQELTGIEVPVKITGPWTKPRVSTDIDAVVKDGNKVVETIKRLGKRLKGRNAEEALRKLLGGGSEQDGSTSQKPSELLRQLLKPQ